jgi:hypothetical protein
VTIYFAASIRGGRSDQAVTVHEYSRVDDLRVVFDEELNPSRVTSSGEPRRYNGRVTERNRPGVTSRRFESNDEADRHDAEYWQQIPPRERVLQVWRLSVEQWQLLGRQPDEPGLCRSVASLRRR